jgi:predicted alpha/beta hydrolase
MSGEPASHTVTTDDGWSLDVRTLPPPGTPCAVVVSGHAMMVDRRSMDRPAGAGLASTLAAGGFAVHLADLRGHGASGPVPAEGGSWTYDDIVWRDLPALVRDARARHPGIPAFLVGHSLAGHCALAAAASGAYAAAGTEPPDGHVLLAVNTWMRGLDPSRWRDVLRWRDMLAFRAATALVGRFPSRTLGMGPADEAKPYVEDLVRTFTSGRWTSRDGAHDYYAGLPGVRGPILSLVGRADRLMAHPEYVRIWSERLTGAALDLRVLAAGDLGLVRDPGHMELVTDPGSRGVWEEIATWMASQVASGAAVPSPREPRVLARPGAQP